MFSFSQTWTTGVVNLNSDYTVQFDIDEETDIVTMTMVGPENKWLGIAPGVSMGIGMGNPNDDVVTYSDMGIEDRRMKDDPSPGEPVLDINQDWTLQSNTTNAGLRTVVAIRARDTGDSEDYTFTAGSDPLPILWAYGTSLTFGYHNHDNGGEHGGTTANVTLSTLNFDLESSFKLSPNPVSEKLTIKLPKATTKAELEIYTILGEKIFSKEISIVNPIINVSNFNSGIYLAKINSKGITVHKRFVKR